MGPPKKANYPERGGRKVSGLQPAGQGSGTAEVEATRDDGISGARISAGHFFGDFGEPTIPIPEGKRRWSGTEEPRKAAQFLKHPQISLHTQSIKGEERHVNQSKGFYPG
jgi:hypothetical protein